MLARILLFFVVISAISGGLGCVVPVDIEAPQQHRPEVLLDLTQPDPREVITVTQESADPVQLVVFVNDEDDQTLTVRLFIDGKYDQPIDPRTNTMPPDPSGPRRAYVLPFGGLCDAFVDFELGSHTLEVFFSDEGFVEAGGDLRIPNPGGQRDSVLWRFECLEALPNPGTGAL